VLGCNVTKGTFFPFSVKAFWLSSVVIEGLETILILLSLCKACNSISSKFPPTTPNIRPNVPRGPVAASSNCDPALPAGKSTPIVPDPRDICLSVGSVVYVLPPDGTPLPPVTTSWLPLKLPLLYPPHLIPRSRATLFDVSTILALIRICGVDLSSFSIMGTMRSRSRALAEMIMELLCSSSVTEPLVLPSLSFVRKFCSVFSSFFGSA